MKKTQFILLVAFAIGFVTIGFAQRRPHGVVPIKNGFESFLLTTSKKFRKQFQ